MIANTETTTGCFRSDHNYANLLNKRFRIGTFKDVTCGGAETKDITAPQTTIAKTVVPAQLDAVTAETDLVTVSVGGNDFELFQQFLFGDPKVTAVTVPQIAQRVTAVLQAVHEKAPDAKVVYVGYPRLADPGAACPKRSPFSAEHLNTTYLVQDQLNRKLKAAAESTGSIYVDLFTPSKGHGLCSGSPWINGQENLLGVAAAYHPFVVEQEAAALLIAQALE